ncbi:GNAT family N-acetyltransferase [Treponema zioleckii]|uniref:GNAT family N-acetyltransferase n=1 Tax=Treponema zioleckii TaxID=331680 RepID=UPI00168AFE90|nr:GNAT family N-acetyltransferase [Treponema zioleckii]
MNYKSEKNKAWIEDENGRQVAVLDFPEVKPGVVNLVHTEVLPEMNGQGLAGKITEFVANELRKQGLKAELTCSYSIRWFSKHPEYNDILNDVEAEAKKAALLAGPACGIQKK